MNRLSMLAMMSVVYGLGCSTTNKGSSLASGGAGTSVLPGGAGLSGGTAGTGVVTGSSGTGGQGSPTAGAAGHPGTAGTGIAGTGTGVAGIGAAGKGAAGTGAAGTGSAGTGAAGMGVAGMGAAGTEGSTFKPPCLKAGKDLVLIGDSYINYMNNLEPRLTMRAIADGALMTGDMFDDHAVPGTSLATPPLLIPPQWDQAVQANPNIKFVVMDGGGNDVLLWNMQCLTDGATPSITTNASCMQTVSDSLAAGMTLMGNMKSAGVAQIVYFFYPEIPAGGHDINDYAIPMVKSACEGGSSSTFECYFLDTRPILTDPSDFISDGIHPSASGDDKLADAVWKLMKDHCMAQPASSGCCTP